MFSRVVITLSFFFMIALYDGAAGGGAKAEPECPPLQPPARNYPVWQSDTNYELVETPIDGGKLIRITGDVLNFDTADFGSIIRDVDKAPNNVRKIVFDAREVRFRQPLSFTSAEVVILADIVTFEKNAAIYLTAAAGDAADGVRIVARTIKFTESLPVPFQFLTSPNKKRSLRVVAQRLEIDGISKTTTAGAELWRRSAGYTGGVSDPPSEWNVRVGEAFKADVTTQIGSEAVWPQFTAFKVQKFFAREPYDAANTAAISKFIELHKPYFEELKATSATVLLDATKALVDLRLDQAGHSAGFVPRRDYLHAFNDLNERIEKSRSYLEDLKNVILQAYDGKALDEKSLKNVRTRLQADDETSRTVRRNIGDEITALAENEAQIAALQVQVDQQKSILAVQLENMKRRNADAGRIKGATTVLAVGAMLIPGAGPFISTGISVTGSMIYTHNIGGDVGSIETLASIAQKNAKFYATTKEVQAAWEQQSKDYEIARQVFAGNPPKPAKPDEKPLDRAEAAKREAQSAGALAGKLKDLFDQLQSLPKPTEVSLNQLEAGDELLGSLLAQIGDYRQRQAKLTERIAKLEQKLAAVAGDQAEALGVEADLLAANPINDKDIMRWKLSAVSLWRREIERLYSDAIMVRRSLFFETGKVPDLPSEVFQFPEEMTAYVRSGLYSPDSGLNSKEITEKHLRGEIDKHVAALRAISRGLSSAFAEFEAERANGAVPYVQSFTFSADASNPLVRNFLERLNAQIVTQMKARSMRSVRVQPLLLPFTLPSGPISEPERLISVAVSDIQFADKAANNGKTINFDIQYNLAGQMVRDGACRYVDMRESRAQSHVVQRIQATSSPAVATQTVVPLTFQEFQRFQTAPPARTPYFLSVQIEGERSDPGFSKSIPLVKSLTFSLKVVQ